MQYLKFCFHEGSGGRGYPKELLEELNANGIPFGAKATDKMPYDAQEIARAHPEIDNTVMYRRSVASGSGSGGPPSGNADVPQYELHPREAAANHWAWHKANLPPELDPTITWVETINEVAQEFVFDEDEEELALAVPRFNLRTVTQRSDGRWVVSNGEWMAEFAKETAVLTMADGYKWAAFGWGPGEPEVSVWHGEKMVEFLSMCANFPDRLAIALHEYSLMADDIWAGNGYLVGRFLKLYGACEDNGINPPTTMMSEWGWTLWDVPDWAEAEAQYLSVGQLYAQYPSIKTAAIWALNEGWQGIADKVAQHIKPLHELTMNTRFPDPVDPPIEPPGDTWEQRAWALSVEEQITRGIPLNPSAGLQKAIFETTDGRWTPVHRERTLEGKTIQAAEELGGTLPRRVYVWEAGKPVWWFYEPDTEPPPPPGTIDAPIYWQRDPRWADHLCGFGPKTIAEWGCLLCVYNMMAEYWGISNGRVPNEENEYYKARGGFSGNNLVSMAMSRVYDQVKDKGWLTRDDPLMEQVARDFLSRGIPVAARVDFNPGTPNWEQHWVLLVGYDATRGYLMNDPWTGKKGVFVSDYYGIPGDDILECIYYYLDDTPPPVGELIDQTQYFMPESGAYGNICTIKTNWGAGNIRQQVQMHGDELFVTKGGEIEVRKLRGSVIDYILDDSRGSGEYHTVQSPNGWLPASARVGDRFVRREIVDVYNKSDCTPTGEHSEWETTMLFADYHPTWTSPGNDQLTYQNVSEWHWIVNGVVEEKYILIPHRAYGLWRNKGGRETVIIEDIPVGSQGNNVFPGACYHAPVGEEYP